MSRVHVFFWNVLFKVADTSLVCVCVCICRPDESVCRTIPYPSLSLSPFTEIVWETEV